MAKVYKLIEIGEYEALKQLLEKNTVQRNSQSEEIKVVNSQLGYSEESSNNSSNSETSDSNQKSTFTECDWRVFEDCFVLSDGGKIHRKKICKRKK